MRILDFLAEGETPITFAEAAKLFPAKANGKHVSVRTLERYFRFGFGGPDLASKVFLEAAKIGNMFVTTRPAVQRFIYGCSLAALRERDRLPKPARKKVATRDLQAVGRA